VASGIERRRCARTGLGQKILCTAQILLDQVSAADYIALVAVQHVGCRAGPIFGRVHIRFKTPGRWHGEDDMKKTTDLPPTIEGEADKGFDAAVSNLKDGVAKATAGFEAGKATMKEGMEKVMKTAEDFVAFGQGNLEAMMKSGQIWAAGVQDLSKHVAATAQASFDETFSTFKALTTVKSFKDAFEIQSTFARTAIEKTVNESSKLTETTLKLTEQTLAPLTARVTVAVEKLAKTA